MFTHQFPQILSNTPIFFKFFYKISSLNSSKVSQRKLEHNNKSVRCLCCNTKVELEQIKKFITCKGCETLVCRNSKCSDFIPGLEIWECKLCKQNRWDFNKQLNWVGGHRKDWIKRQNQKASTMIFIVKITNKNFWSLSESFSKRQENGYCLNWIPDQKIPVDLPVQIRKMLFHSVEIWVCILII